MNPSSSSSSSSLFYSSPVLLLSQYLSDKLELENYLVETIIKFLSKGCTQNTFFPFHYKHLHFDQSKHILQLNPSSGTHPNFPFDLRPFMRVYETEYSHFSVQIVKFNIRDLYQHIDAYSASIPSTLSTSSKGPPNPFSYVKNYSIPVDPRGSPELIIIAEIELLKLNEILSSNKDNLNHSQENEREREREKEKEKEKEKIKDKENLFQRKRLTKSQKKKIKQQYIQTSSTTVNASTSSHSTFNASQFSIPASPTLQRNSTINSSSSTTVTNSQSSENKIVISFVLCQQTIEFDIHSVLNEWSHIRGGKIIAEMVTRKLISQLIQTNPHFSLYQSILSFHYNSSCDTLHL